MALPETLVLIAFVDAIRAAVAEKDVEDQFTVRHKRHRESTDEEVEKGGCLTIQFVEVNPVPQSASGSDDALSTAEELWEVGVNVIAESELPAEAFNESDPDDDPTGFGTVDAMHETVLDMMFTAGEEVNRLDGLLFDATYDGSAEADVDPNPDRVTVAKRWTLVYRARKEKPNDVLTGS